MSLKFIMLVESDINLRQSMALILQRDGYCITATDCFSRALDLLQLGGYHTLISDIDLPESVDHWLPKFIALHPQMPIVILTDEPSSEVERHRERFKAHYLVKPVAPEHLLAIVGSILAIDNLSNSITFHRIPLASD
jgi:DNA-binding response OmpR family regulator